MKRKNKKAKPAIFFGFVLSLGLHLFLLITILTPASIKKPQSISGRLVTLEKATRSGPKGSSGIKQQSKPKVEKKEIKEVVKPKPKPKPKPKIVEKPKPKPETKPKPEPVDKKVVNLNQEKEKEKPKPKPKPKPVAKKTPSAEKQAQEIINKMKNERAKDDILENMRKETQVAKVDSNPYDITGSDRNLSASTNSLIANRFVEMIRSEIAANWIIPPNIPTDGSLESKVSFKIDEYGKVFDIKIEKSSGNSAFDEFCKRALRKASPLNAPPPEILHEAKTEGVEVSFSNNPSY